MALRIPVIDNLAFKLFQLAQLIQWLITATYFRFFPPEGLKEEIKAMNLLMSPQYLMSAELNELPEIIQDKVLAAGRILLLSVSLPILMGVIKYL